MLPDCFFLIWLSSFKDTFSCTKTSDTADKSQPWETMMVALAAPRSEVEQNLFLKGMELSGHAGTRLEVFQSWLIHVASPTHHVLPRWETP